MKSFKRFAAMGAAFMLAVSMMSFGASAQSVTMNSTGGSYGYFQYALSVSKRNYSHGIDFTCLRASAIQQKIGGNYVPINSITFTATIHLKSGGNSISTYTTTSKDAQWDSNGVATSAVVNAPEIGTVYTYITSTYYGSISKTLSNV